MRSIDDGSVRAQDILRLLHDEMATLAGTSMPEGPVTPSGSPDNPPNATDLLIALPRATKAAKGQDLLPLAEILRQQPDPLRERFYAVWNAGEGTEPLADRMVTALRRLAADDSIADVLLPPPTPASDAVIQAYANPHVRTSLAARMAATGNDGPARPVVFDWQALLFGPPRDRLPGTATGPPRRGNGTTDPPGR